MSAPPRVLWPPLRIYSTNHRTFCSSKRNRVLKSDSCGILFSLKCLLLRKTIISSILLTLQYNCSSTMKKHIRNTNHPPHSTYTSKRSPYYTSSYTKSCSGLDALFPKKILQVGSTSSFLRIATKQTLFLRSKPFSF